MEFEAQNENKTAIFLTIFFNEMNKKSIETIDENAIHVLRWLLHCIHEAFFD